MSKGCILMTGASGFLGWNMLQDPWPEWAWTGVYNQHDPAINGIRCLRADLTDPSQIVDLLDAVQPDVVLHAAAVTDVKRCEVDPAHTESINVEVPMLLARHCCERAIRFVFTSSDMVFDGAHPPYSEDCPPCPINAYGRQKARAESQVLAVNPDAVVCRMPLMFGAGGPFAHNFVPEWIGKLKRNEPLKLFTDEFRAPVSAAEASQGLRCVVEKSISGIIHLGGRERMSRYAFGVLLCDVWSLDRDLLQPTRRADVGLDTVRPADTFLLSERAWNWGYAAASLDTQLRAVKGILDGINRSDRIGGDGADSAS